MTSVLTLLGVGIGSTACAVALTLAPPLPVNPPARVCRFAWPSARAISGTLSRREASRSGSNSTRSCRLAPPMITVSATNGTYFTASSTCAMRRRRVR